MPINTRFLRLTISLAVAVCACSGSNEAPDVPAEGDANLTDRGPADSDRADATDSSDDGAADDAQEDAEPDTTDDSGTDSEEVDVGETDQVDADAHDSADSTDGFDVDGADSTSVTAIDGPPGALAVSAIPELPPRVSDDADFVIFNSHRVSFRELLVLIEEDATVAELNAILAENAAELVGALGGNRVLLLRLPTVDLAEMSLASTDVGAAAGVVWALPNSGGASDALPPQSVDHPTEWDWSQPQFSGNWGLAMVRAPQAWHFDDFVRRHRDDVEVFAGVIEHGFTDEVTVGVVNSTHPDFQTGEGDTRLRMVAPLSVWGPLARPRRPGDHGTLVTGVIAAGWDDRVGLEGIDPWTTVYATYGVDVFAQTQQGTSLLGTYPAVRTLNLSFGFSSSYDESDICDDGAQNGSFQPNAVPYGQFNDDGIFEVCFNDLNGDGIRDTGERYFFEEWGRDLDGDGLPDAGLDGDGDGVDDTWADKIRYESAIWQLALDLFGPERDDFVIVTSAGNGGNNFAARYNWGTTFLADTVGGRFLSVESVNSRNVLSSFSTVGGSVAAPGECVRATEVDNGTNYDSQGCQSAFSGRSWSDGGSDVHHATSSGTSFSAPHVTGLVTLLWRLAPDLTTDQIRTLVLANAQPSATANTNTIDAFASAMAIDDITGQSTMLHALVDVDDTTEDGSQRTVRERGNVVTDALYGHDDDFTTSDGTAATVSRPRMRGDGQIDMADFRAFRDALLYAQGGALLDGDPSHSSFDLNQDGVVEAGRAEALFARFDFNGDGELSETDTPRQSQLLLPAAFVDLTDLGVLQLAWPADASMTDGVSADQLPNLLWSGDVVVHLDDVLAWALTEVTLTISGDGFDPIVRTYTPPLSDLCDAGISDVRVIMTVPSGDDRLLNVTLEGHPRLLVPPIPFPKVFIGEDIRVDPTVDPDISCLGGCGPGEACCALGATAFCHQEGQCPSPCLTDCHCGDGTVCCAVLGNVCVAPETCDGGCLDAVAVGSVCTEEVCVVSTEDCSATDQFCVDDPDLGGTCVACSEGADCESGTCFSQGTAAANCGCTSDDECLSTCADAATFQRYRCDHGSCVEASQDTCETDYNPTSYCFEDDGVAHCVECHEDDHCPGTYDVCLNPGTPDAICGCTSHEQCGTQCDGSAVWTQVCDDNRCTLAGSIQDCTESAQLCIQSSTGASCETHCTQGSDCPSGVCNDDGSCSCEWEADCHPGYCRNNVAYPALCVDSACSYEPSDCAGAGLFCGRMPLGEIEVAGCFPCNLCPQVDCRVVTCDPAVGCKYSPADLGAFCNRRIPADGVCDAEAECVPGMTRIGACYAVVSGSIDLADYFTGGAGEESAEIVIGSPGYDAVFGVSGSTLSVGSSADGIPGAVGVVVAFTRGFETQELLVVTELEGGGGDAQTPTVRSYDADTEAIGEDEISLPLIAPYSEQSFFVGSVEHGYSCIDGRGCVSCQIASVEAVHAPSGFAADADCDETCDSDQMCMLEQRDPPLHVCRTLDEPAARACSGGGARNVVLVDGPLAGQCLPNPYETSPHFPDVEGTELGLGGHGITVGSIGNCEMVALRITWTSTPTSDWVELMPECVSDLEAGLNVTRVNAVVIAATAED